jgi:hypothetical protein
MDRPVAEVHMAKLFRNNGLSLVLAAVFLLTMTGQALTGWREHNNEQREHGAPPLGLGEYLKSGHFWEATAENWESEFLQMAMFVVLTACLYQKGSAESKDPDEEHDPVDNDPSLSRHDPEAPWPVRKGGFVLWLYSNSLSITFVILFLASFAIHAAKGAEDYNDEQRQHGQAAVTAVQYVGTSRFWFESLQNWQSEFLSLLAMVVFTIFLRQRGSPESKPVAAPHRESGEDEPAPVGTPVPAGARAAEI